MTDMTLQQIIERLAALDEEVRASTAVEAIEKAAAEKTELLARKAELDALETRKQTALNIQAGTAETKTIETRKEEKHMFENMSREDVLASPEYRSIFLKSLMGKPLTDIEKREYDAFNTASGVAAVPAQTANMIFDSMTKIAPMLNEITLLRVAGGLRFAVQGARAAAAVHVENAGPVAAAADTLTTITLTGFEFIKIISISATMSAMAVPAFESWLVKILAEDLAVVIDNEIINTTNTTGGIVDGPAGGWVENTNQITYVPGNGLSHANVMALIALLPAAYESNAKFVMNKATFWTQFAAMEDANGNPIINPDLAAPGKYMVRGFPVLIDDNVAASEAYFGDFKKVVGNLSQDIKIDKSAEAGFMNNSIYFRGTAIFDCDVADPAAIVKLNV